MEPVKAEKMDEQSLAEATNAREAQKVGSTVTSEGD
jgi:hypothetical protein